jgi:hypothetical protein
MSGSGTFKQAVSNESTDGTPVLPLLDPLVLEELPLDPEELLVVEEPPVDPEEPVVLEEPPELDPVAELLPLLLDDPVVLPPLEEPLLVHPPDEELPEDVPEECDDSPPLHPPARGPPHTRTHAASFVVRALMSRTVRSSASRAAIPAGT